jgi:hypothetical protein
MSWGEVPLRLAALTGLAPLKIDGPRRIFAGGARPRINVSSEYLGIP